MLYNICTGIYKFGNNAYPRRIRRRSNLGNIFWGKNCVSWAGKYGIYNSISSHCWYSLQVGSTDNPNLCRYHSIYINQQIHLIKQNSSQISKLLNVWHWDAILREFSITKKYKSNTLNYVWHCPHWKDSFNFTYFVKPQSFSFVFLHL